MNQLNHIAQGFVVSLAINGDPVPQITFNPDGPLGDIHAGFDRKLSGHDGDYIRTSGLLKGAAVFNWRSWTGVSVEELASVEQALNYEIPIGCLLENIRIEGIPHFSKLTPGVSNQPHGRNNQSSYSSGMGGKWTMSDGWRTSGKSPR